MLAQGANVILRQGIAFIYIAADLANKALLFCFRLGLYILLIVGVGHGFNIVEVYTLNYITDEPHVGLQIDLTDHIAGNIAVGIAIQEQKPIGRTLCVFKICKFIHIPTGLEAEVLENLKGCFLREGGNV